MTTLSNQKTLSQQLPPSGPSREVIGLPGMMNIEAAVNEQVWIVAEEKVVTHLVEADFLPVTKSNLLKGVNYRFLVSKSSEKSMMDFRTEKLNELQPSSPGSDARLGRILVHAIPDASLKVMMPGCIFDPPNGESYFRSHDNGNFFWFRLSSEHHTRYVDGFKAVWPLDHSLARKASIRFILSWGIPLLIACLGFGALMAFLLYRLASYSLGKSALGSFLIALTGWLVVISVLGKRDALVRRTLWFQWLGDKAVSAVIGTIGLGILGSFIYDLLK